MYITGLNKAYTHWSSLLHLFNWYFLGVYLNSSQVSGPSRGNINLKAR
jgi:hypothetical protein